MGYLFDSSRPYMLGVLGLVPGTADQAFVGRRFDSDGLLKQAIEQLAPGTGSATIEAESELVQVVRQMVRTDSTLVSPQQPGHNGFVRSVAISANGQVLASAGWGDKTVKLWDVSTGRELQSLWGHADSIDSVAFSPDGSTLASGSEDKTVKLWEVATGHELRTLAGRAYQVGPVDFSPDGRILVSQTENGPRVWNLLEGRQLAPLGTYTSCAFSPDGRTAAYGTWQRIDLWDTANKRMLRTLAGHTAYVDSVAFSPNGRILASGANFTPAWDPTVTEHGRGVSELKLWDVDSGRELRTLTAGQVPYYLAESLKFSPDGHILASGGELIKLWDVSSGQELRTLRPDRPDFRLRSVAFSPDGRTLASGTFPAKAQIWDVATGKDLPAITFGTVSSVSWFNDVAFSPDGRILASANQGGTVTLWEFSSRRELRTLAGNTSSANFVAFSPDGRTLASGSETARVKLWDLSSGRELASLFALEQSDWVVSDPEGRFDTTNLDEIKGVSWVFPDEPLRALPPEIFMRDYFVPKLLPRLLRGERLPEIRSLTSLNRAQPTVEVVKVEPEAEQELVSATVKVTSTCSEVQKDVNGSYLKSGAFDLRLFRDGQLVGQWPESKAGERSGARAASAAELGSWRNLHEIKLVDGEYIHTFRHIRLPHRAGVDKVQFTAYAFNSDRVKSLTTPPLEYSVPRVSESRLAVVRRRAYLVSMGVNANQSRWNLDFAVPSAQDGARLLHEKLAKDYEVIDISLFSTLAPDSPRVLLQQATKANLKAVLDLLAGKTIDSALGDAVDPDHKLRPATPDDAVVLFISSHGYADPEGTFYVVPYDTGAAPGVTEVWLTHCQAHAEDRSAQCARAKAFLKHTFPAGSSRRGGQEWMRGRW